MARGAAARFLWVVTLRRPTGAFWRQVFAGDELVAKRVFARTRDNWTRAERCDFVGCSLVLSDPAGKERDRWEIVAPSESSGAA